MFSVQCPESLVNKSDLRPVVESGQVKRMVAWGSRDTSSCPVSILAGLTGNSLSSENRLAVHKEVNKAWIQLQLLHEGSTHGTGTH